MRKLTADQTHRLYEALSTVADATPMAMRRNLIAVWRRVAWHLPDTEQHRSLRGRLYRRLPTTVKPDWTWVLKILSDEGAGDVFTTWGTDAGYFRATST